jgi:aryl-alcohol dehydrogenase-like predicted oxidoreductase
MTWKNHGRIGLGLAAIGRPAYINAGRSGDLGDQSQRTPAYLQDRAHRLLDATWDAGVRYFDAARSYGHAEK